MLPLLVSRHSRNSCGGLLPAGCAALALFVAARLPAAETAAFEPPELFQYMCFECHGEGSSKGSFALDELFSKGAGPAHQGMWKKVWTNIRHEFMPPATANYMTPEERREAARWIEQEVFGVDPAQIDPGVVTIRRLNREEYQHTVEDLFAAEFDLRDKLLPDDTAYGFDNIGDAQTLSPVLFNRYLEIAEYIVREVILDEGRPLPRFTFDALGPRRPDGLPRRSLNARDGTEQSFEVELSHDGRYQLELGFEIGGWHDFGGDIVVTVHVGDQLVGEQTAPLGGEANYDYQWGFTAPKGTHEVVFRATPGPQAGEGAQTVTETPAVEPTPAELLTQLESNLAQPQGDQPANDEQRRRRERAPRRFSAELKFKRLEMAVTGPVDAGMRADYPEPHQRIFFRGDAPDDEAGRREYASEILRRIADRAFHRPVDGPTLARLTQLAMADDNFERGVGSAITAILASPRFLYREEVQPQPDDPHVSHPVDEYALASRLSYLLWLSIPDDELNALAAAGQLRENLDAQVDRMLADPKSERFFRDFTGQWLRTRNVLMTPISPSRVADTINPVREEMKLETDALFNYIARNDRDLIELINADYTFLNEELAEFYGITGVTGDEIRKVNLAASGPRGGVLTHGSFLVSTSNPDRTSPVKRGVFVLENLLGTPPPPPPAAVPSLEEAKKEGVELKTLRDQLAAHREDTACAACHAHFDPIGLALENFSNLGQWRDTEEDQPIDASGEMVTGEQFDDFSALRSIIAGRKDKFYRCVTEKLMTYALGRGLEPYDAVTVDAITDRLLRENGKFSTLLGALIESPAFQMRRGDGNPNAVAMSAPSP